MKKKILFLTIIMMLIVSLFALTGCSNTIEESKNELIENKEEIIDNNKKDSKEAEQENTKTSEENKETEKDIYFEVLEGKRNYISELNTQVTFDASSKSIKYAILDMDEDEKDEMVIQIDGEDYLILNLEDDIIYGFEVVLRGLLNLKTDGSYMASGGAASNGILKSSFSKNKRIETVLAQSDIYETNPYMINNKVVTESEVNKYFEEFNKKENIAFTAYEKGSTNKEATSENDTSFKEGTFSYKVTTDAENNGSIHSIKFQSGIATWQETYFGEYVSGNYTISGDKITVNYTLHKGFDQGTDLDYEEKINKTIIYTIVNENEIKGNEPYVSNIVETFKRN